MKGLFDPKGVATHRLRTTAVAQHITLYPKSNRTFAVLGTEAG